MMSTNTVTEKKPSVVTKTKMNVTNATNKKEITTNNIEVLDGVEKNKMGGKLGTCGCDGGTIKEHGGEMKGDAYKSGGETYEKGGEAVAEYPAHEMPAPTSSKSDVANKLNGVLANYQIFYQNLRSLHWNIEGVMFFELHNIYGDLYAEIGTRLDDVAERVLALKGTPVDTFSEYLKLSTIKEVSGVTDGIEGVKVVISNFETILGKEKETMMISFAAHDKATCVSLAESAGCIEKHLWTLNKYIK